MPLTEKKKSILHVLNISFGLRYFIGDQFEYFLEKGIEFHVACKPDSFLYDYARQKKFIPHEINIVRAINPFKDIIAIFQVIKIIRKQKIDIVIGHTPKGGLISMIAAAVIGLNQRIYVRHGLMYQTSAGMEKLMLKTMERLTGYLAKKVVCVSESILEISNREKLSPRKINIIFGKGTPNGIDCYGRFNEENISKETRNELMEQYKISSENKVVGYVGRLVKDKGIVELYESWQLLKKEVDNITLLLVGPFEERDGINQEIKDKIFSDISIICTGTVENGIEKYYSIMDVFILPSYREGLPTVTLEASAMKLPIVTTKVTGCIDSIIENETGIFADLIPRDIKDKLLFYLNNPEIALSHGVAGRKFVINNFEQSFVWSEIEKYIYNN